MERPTIFTVPGLDGYLRPSQAFTTGLKPGQPFFIFELPGLRSDTPPLKHIEDIAQWYCRQLVDRYPTGQVYLAAFCSGSFVAFEMEHQLRQLGRSVDKMVLVDPLLTSGLVDLYRAGTWDCPLALERLRDETRRAGLEKRFRAMLVRQRQRGQDPLDQQYRGEAFSINARATFVAALNCYKPGPVQTTVDVIVSVERNAGYNSTSVSPSVWDGVIPRRRVSITSRTHAAINTSQGTLTATILQRAFDRPAQAGL